jgi:hypothetical protein
MAARRQERDPRNTLKYAKEDKHRQEHHLVFASFACLVGSSFFGYSAFFCSLNDSMILDLNLREEEAEQEKEGKQQYDM